MKRIGFCIKDRLKSPRLEGRVTFGGNDIPHQEIEIIKKDAYTDLELTWMRIGAAREREACAEVCETMDEFTSSDAEHDALWNAANKIRMRSTGRGPKD
jgi:hypothetical protein